jgi:hypothetical protein
MERLSITHGMHVADAQGNPVGVVDVCGTTHVLLHRGVLKPQHFAVKLLDVKDLEEGTVHLREGAALIPPAEAPDLQSGPKMGVLPFRRSLLEDAAHSA